MLFSTNDEITILGSVNDVAGNVSVILQIVFSGDLIHDTQVDLLSNGTFSYSVKVTGIQWLNPGEYC